MHKALLALALAVGLSACTTVVNVNSDVSFNSTSKDTVTTEEVYMPDSSTPTPSLVEEFVETVTE